MAIQNSLHSRGHLVAVMNVMQCQICEIFAPDTAFDCVTKSEHGIVGL